MHYRPILALPALLSVLAPLACSSGDGPSVSSASNWLVCETTEDCAPVGGLCGAENVCVDGNEEVLAGCHVTHSEVDSSDDCLGDGICYELADGSWCTGGEEPEPLPSTCLVSGTIERVPVEVGEDVPPLEVAEVILATLDLGLGEPIATQRLPLDVQLPVEYCIQGFAPVDQPAPYWVYVNFKQSSTEPSDENLVSPRDPLEELPTSDHTVLASSGCYPEDCP